jgi:predicted  nucleic acid-binding Zn-ribbon protein
MKVATVLLIMSLLGVSTLAAQNRVVIDKTKLRNLARDAGVLSMIETKESVVEPPAVSIDATPQDVQSGDFEIKCATSCDFVKKGSAEFVGSAGVNGVAGSQGKVGSQVTDAAQNLEELYLKMAALQDKLAKEPTSETLIKQRQALSAKINAQSALLNALAGGGAMEAPVSPNDQKRIEAAESKLQTIQAQLAGSPDDPALKAMRDQLKKEIEQRNDAVIGAKKIEAHRKEVSLQLTNLNEKLDKLKAQSGALPNDATLKDQIVKTQEAIAKISTQDLTPKETCVRTCAQPGMQGKDQGSANCVRMCVKMFRAVTYHVAKKFL